MRISALENRLETIGLAKVCSRSSHSEITMKGGYESLISFREERDWLRDCANWCLQEIRPVEVLLHVKWRTKFALFRLMLDVQDRPLWTAPAFNSYISGLRFTSSAEAEKNTCTCEFCCHTFFVLWFTGSTLSPDYRLTCMLLTPECSAFAAFIVLLILKYLAWSVFFVFFCILCAICVAHVCCLHLGTHVRAVPQWTQELTGGFLTML